MRGLLVTAALGALLVAAAPVLAAEGDRCTEAREIQGFKTCADVEKAEAEGEVVVYATNPEAAELRVLAEFTKLFPKIKTNYTGSRPARFTPRSAPSGRRGPIRSMSCRSPIWG